MESNGKMAPFVISISDWRSILHMSFTSRHIGKYAGIISCTGSPIDGKRIIKEYEVKYRSGRPVGKENRTYYIDEQDSPMFNSMADLVDHYLEATNRP